MGNIANAAVADDRSLTVAELMTRWKMSRKALLEAIREGRVRAFRPGRRVYRVTMAEVIRIETAAND